MTTLGDMVRASMLRADETADVYVESLLGDLIRSSPAMKEPEVEIARIKKECARICFNERYDKKDNTLRYLIDQHRKYFAAIQPLLVSWKGDQES